jgi:hypothetical protein
LQRFVFARGVPQDPLPPVTHINLVQTWVEELKAGEVTRLTEGVGRVRAKLR